MPKLSERFKKEIASKLSKELGVENFLALPRLKKVTVNVGVGKMAKEANFIETVENNLIRITGQKPVRTLARQSISGFKVREGQEVGLKVTLRGERMYAFIDKLVHVTLARVRDFRGLNPSVVDKSGQLSLGLREYIVFPEINPDEVNQLHGLEVSITTTAKTRDQGLALFKALGFLFS